MHGNTHDKQSGEGAAQQAGWEKLHSHAAAADALLDIQGLCFGFHLPHGNHMIDEIATRRRCTHASVRRMGLQILCSKLSLSRVSVKELVGIWIERMGYQWLLITYDQAVRDISL
jgi:hypothetical protein